MAAALESLYRDHADIIAADLARHYEEAGEDDHAVACLIQAGDAAFRAYAQAEAADYYSRGLALARTGSVTAHQLEHLHMRRGRALELADRYDEAVTNYEEMQALAQSRGDRHLELVGLMARALAHAVGSRVWDLRKAQALAFDALELARDSDDRVAECRVYWILLLSNRFGMDGARKAAEYGERSLALARVLGLQEQLALTVKDLAVAYAVMGRFRESGALGREAVDLWRKLDNKPMLAEALGGQVAQRFAAGELDEALAAGEESVALNRSIHNRFGLSITAGFTAMANEELGNMDAAIQGINEATSIAQEIGLRSGLAWRAGVDLAGIYAFLGDFNRAVAGAEQAIATADPDVPARLIIPKAVLAEVCLQRGQPFEAEALLAPYGEITFRDTLEATAAISAQPLFAQAKVALAQGDLARVLALTEDLLASAQSMGMAILLPTSLHLRAKALWVLGRTEEAYAMLLEGRARAEAMHARARLLPILTTLREFEFALAHPIEAEAARVAACDVVAYIAEHSPEYLRASFLSLPAVRAIAGA